MSAGDPSAAPERLNHNYRVQEAQSSHDRNLSLTYLDLASKGSQALGQLTDTLLEVARYTLGWAY